MSRLAYTHEMDTLGSFYFIYQNRALPTMPPDALQSQQEERDKLISPFCRGSRMNVGE